MRRKPRIYYTETDKALMWDRWRKGEMPGAEINARFGSALFFTKRLKVKFLPTDGCFVHQSTLGKGKDGHAPFP